MLTFPILSTGAVCQYPTQVSYQQAVQVLRFMDGSDQRFLLQGRQFRRWEVQLSLLNEGELSALEDFFRAQLGNYLKFNFTDPFTNSIVANCVLRNPEMASSFLQTGDCAVSLWVVETNG